MTDNSYSHDTTPTTEWAPATVHTMHRMRHLSWSAVFAGIVMALAVQIVLSLFGVALGLASVNATNFNASPSATSVGVGTAMWAAVSILVSLFYGGFIAARFSKTSCHHEGILRGLVVWAGSAVLVVCLLSSAVGSVFTGVGHIMGGAGVLSAAGAKRASVHVPMDASDAMKREASDLINGNQPPAAGMTSDQAQADIVAQFAVLSANSSNAAIARQRIIADLQTQGVSPADAEARVTDWQNKAEATKQKAKQTADMAAHAAAKAATAAGVILLLSALTAGFGGLLGAAHVAEREKHHAMKANQGVR